jgi:hypothetical protein
MPPDLGITDVRVRRLVMIAGALALIAGLLVGIPAEGKTKRRDRDHDGLSDRAEKKRFSTAPRRADTDRDGLRDGPEIKRFKTNPRRRDTDGDKLRDGREVHRLKTKPRKKDTDGDGLKDGAEVRRFRTNPRKKDTDGDGLSDRAELRRFKTNPRKKDTDGDGVSDGREVRRGTNPRRARRPRGLTPPPQSPGRPGRPVRPCSSVVTSIASAQSAVSSAAPGAVICLADGSYGQVNLSGRKAGEVVLQAQNPGRATIAGADLNGAWLTLASFNVTSDVEIQPGSEHVTVEFNRISGGYFGINAGPTDDTYISDTTLRGNKLVGNFGEDALRVNRYHDGPDADPFGLLIYGNEISGVRENGAHSDCLQSVWGGDSLYFVRNYLHDNRCQGFFIKDQPGTVDTVVVQDNLFVRNGEPCDPPSSGCGQPSVFQLFGPMTNLRVVGNTIWTPEGGSPVTLRSSGWGRVDVNDNVIYRLWSDTSAPFGNYGASNNLACKREQSWPAAGVAINCNPGFPNAAAGDYRVPGRGVSWAVADQPYGP